MKLQMQVCVTLVAAFLPPVLSSFLNKPFDLSGIGSSSFVNSEQKVRDLIPSQVLDFDVDTLAPVATSKQILGDIQTGFDTTKEVVDSIQQWKELTAETYADNAGKAIVDLLGAGTDKLQEYYPFFKEIEEWQLGAAKDYQNAIQRATDQGQTVYESVLPEGLRNGEYLSQVKAAQGSFVGPYNRAITKLVTSDTYQPAKLVNKQIADAYEGGITGFAEGTSNKIIQPTYSSLVDQAFRNKGIAEGYQNFITKTSDHILKPTGEALASTAANLRDINRGSVAPAYEQIITSLVNNPVVSGISQQAGGAIASTQSAQRQAAEQYESTISQFATDTVVPLWKQARGQVQSLLDKAIPEEASQLRVAESYNEFVTQGYNHLSAFLQTTYATQVQPFQLDLAKQYGQFITEKSVEVVDYISTFDFATLPSQIDQIVSSLPQ